MYIAMNCITIDPERADDFERAFLGRERLLSQATGFIRFEFLRSSTPGSEYVVCTLWESEESFRGWVGSDLFRRAHQREGSRAFGGHSRLRTYEVLDSELADSVVY